MRSLIARPTEYKGIQYRSKCEAMFAMWLDISQSWGEAFEKENYNNTLGLFKTGFCYEPSFLSVNKWTPDFLLWRVTPGGRGESNGMNGLPYLYWEVIEYKPSRPTQTYVDGFYSKCFEVWNKFSDDKCYHIDFNIYYGSIFNADRGMFKTHAYEVDRIGFHHDPVDWMGDKVEAIQSYRFDLEDS